MPLKVSLADRMDATRQRKRSRAAELVAQGLCAKCRRSHTRGTHYCGRCHAKSLEYQRRRRSGRVIERAKPDTSHYNFDTDDLIVRHVPDAKKLAWWMSQRLPPSTSVDIDDIVGDAMYGLVLAARTFDPSYGVAFEGWAATRIRGEIYNGFTKWTHGGMKSPPKFVALADEWE
jgi:hypothetical protein